MPGKRKKKPRAVLNRRRATVTLVPCPVCRGARSLDGVPCVTCEGKGKVEKI